MNILRKQEMTVENMGDCRIGDQIQVGKYTATCQKVTDDAAVFLLDQYLDNMNPTNTNGGGYKVSELRRTLQVVAANDENFASIRERMRPFDNGELLRIPTVGEMFGYDDFYEMDDAEQWELMKDRRNRIADREGEEYEWGWLQNKVRNFAAYFSAVGTYGYALSVGASNDLGVRPVFQLVGSRGRYPLKETLNKSSKEGKQGEIRTISP